MTTKSKTDREIFDEAVRAKGNEPSDEMWAEFHAGFTERVRERVRNRAKDYGLDEDWVDGLLADHTPEQVAAYLEDIVNEPADVRDTPEWMARNMRISLAGFNRHVRGYFNLLAVVEEKLATADSEDLADRMREEILPMFGALQIVESSLRDWGARLLEKVHELEAMLNGGPSE